MTLLHYAKDFHDDTIGAIVKAGTVDRPPRMASNAASENLARRDLSLLDTVDRRPSFRGGISPWPDSPLMQALREHHPSRSEQRFLGLVKTLDLITNNPRHPVSCSTLRLQQIYLPKRVVRT